MKKVCIVVRVNIFNVYKKISVFFYYYNQLFPKQFVYKCVEYKIKSLEGLFN